MGFAALASLAGCGDDPQPSPSSDFSFEESFEFEEPGNVDPNVDPNAQPNTAPNGSTNNSVVVPPACPTTTLGGEPARAVAIDDGGAGPIVALASGDRVETFRREEGEWRPVITAPATEDVTIQVAGITQGRTSQFWLTTTDVEQTVLYQCTIDACIERKTFAFGNLAYLHSTSDSVVYVAGVTLDAPIPTFELRFVQGQDSNRAAFAEALSIPTQFGGIPTAIPADPRFRTEFRFAWDTGDLPLSLITVNTSLLMEFEPECNRLDILGGRIVPLRGEKGIVASVSNDRGAAITWDGCDATSAPVALEASRGMLDFDVVSVPEDPETNDLYWLQAGSVWGATIDGRTGRQTGPRRRIATTPGAQAIRATAQGDERIIAVATEEGVLVTSDDMSCAEFFME